MERLTDKEEGYVQGLLKGLSQREAYKQSYNAKNMNDDTIDVKASLLLKKDRVRIRCDELKDKVLAKVEERGLFTATDVLNEIHDIVVATRKDDPKTSLKGLELYGKHLKLFTDKIEVGITELPEIVIKRGEK